MSQISRVGGEKILCPHMVHPFLSVLCSIILCGIGGAIAGCSRVPEVLAFSPDGKQFLSGGDDGGIKLWDSQTFQCLRTFIGERPYERMNISNARGLTDAQKAALKALGAIELAEGA